MDLSYLIIDNELKKLLEKLAEHHPEGSKEVLKLVLKLYLKLLDKSKRKGRDPLLVFKDLVERIVSGKLYETTGDKINHLDGLLEVMEMQTADLGNASFIKDIKEIKSRLNDLTSGGAPQKSAADFTPTDSSKLIKVTESDEPKKRQNYKELRKKNPPKKIKF